MSHAAPTPDRTEQFIALLAQAEPQLNAYILSLLPRWADADEVRQQTHITLWRKFDHFEPGTNFTAWACAIARYEVLKYRQALSRDRLIFSDEAIHAVEQTVRDHTDHLSDERDALAQCLEKLTDDERELTRLAYAADTPINQIAVEVGVSANTLYKRLHRIRRSLLDCVQRTLGRSPS